MPTYEFRCEVGHATDRFFSNMSSAPSEIDCPECGEPAVRQVSGGIGLLFKGSGFYITDYGKDGKKPRTTDAPANSESATADAGKESAKNTGGESAKSGSSEASGATKPAAAASKAESKPSPTKPKSE